jgi:asparagine synthase (glutamine-hydrolysing)
MCGIYGITAKDPEFIQNFIEICKHRGPDGESVWTSDEVTLGHNLLSIMASPANSQQPWKTPNGNILVYNGEIFNYYELKEKYKTLLTRLDVIQNYLHGVWTSLEWTSLTR